MTGNVQLYLPEADQVLPRMRGPLCGFSVGVKARRGVEHVLRRVDRAAVALERGLLVLDDAAGALAGVGEGFLHPFDLPDSVARHWGERTHSAAGFKHLG